MKMPGRFSATLLLVLLVAVSASAHESRPGYLQLTLTDEESVDLLLKIPALGDMRLGLYPNLPTNCVAEDSPTRYIIDNAYTERASFQCSGGLLGQTVAIDGLSTTLTDVLVRVERQDGTEQIARLTPSKTSFVVEATPGALAVATTYLTLGVNHILSGIDHLLFVFALLLLVEGTRKLVWTITAFTAAHSLTLAAATLGLVQVPQSPVEAVIALSIVFVASEIVHVSQGRPGLTQRRPWIVAFVFGLLHGFGFAGALNEIGLPEQSIPLSQ
jgi:hydrogenase/urease accessory protein HupE